MPRARLQCAHFPAQILSAGGWLDSLWARRAQLEALPTLLLWGERDIAFREQELGRWIEALPGAIPHRLAVAGHCPHETHPVETLALLRPFLAARTM